MTGLPARLLRGDEFRLRRPGNRCGSVRPAERFLEVYRLLLLWFWMKRWRCSVPVQAMGLCCRFPSILKTFWRWNNCENTPACGNTHQLSEIHQPS